MRISGIDWVENDKVDIEELPSIIELRDEDLVTNDNKVIINYIESKYGAEIFSCCIDKPKYGCSFGFIHLKGGKRYGTL